MKITEKKLREIIRETYLRIENNNKGKREKLLKELSELEDELRGLMMDDEEDLLLGVEKDEKDFAFTGGPEAEPTTKPTTAPPTTKPGTRKNPLKPVIKPGAKPRPKAKKLVGNQELERPESDVFGSIHEQYEKELKIITERKRMLELINEAPMHYPGDDFDGFRGDDGGGIDGGDGPHPHGQERPHPGTQQRIQDRENSGATPYSHIDMFKRGGMDYNTLEKISSDEFKQILDSLKDVGKMRSPQEVMGVLQQIQTMEQPHVRQLEQIAKSIVQKEFGLSDDFMLLIEATLAPPQGNIDMEEDEPVEDLMQDLEPILTDDELERLPSEQNIRKIMNSLLMGAGYRLHEAMDDVKGALDALDERLHPLYKRFMPNVELFLWQFPVDMPTENRQDWGRSEMKMPEKEEEQPEEEQPEEEAPQVEGRAFAIIFPVLIHEIGKIAVEMLTYTRISRESEGMQMAILAVDSYEEEHWHKMLGPQLWKQFYFGIKEALSQYENATSVPELYGVDSKEEFIPVLLQRIALLPGDDLLNLLDDLINASQHDAEGRTNPIERIYNMIHTLNMEVKEYLDQEEGDDIEGFEKGEIDFDGLQSKLQVDLEDLKDAAAEEETEDTAEEPSGEKSIQQMDRNELAAALEQALADEDYEEAAKIRDILSN